jgi:manganese efflux pump family protein
VLRILLLIVPLAFDTFAVSAALGVGGLQRQDRLRLSLLFAGFQAGMPLVGFALGRALGAAVGGVAEYVAVATLVALGVYMLFEGESDEASERSSRVHGWALIGLGVSVSLDELAIGFALGLLRLPIIPVLILIGIQAFVAAQLGMRLGDRVGARVGESAERVAGAMLVLLGLVLLVLRVA